MLENYNTLNGPEKSKGAPLDNIKALLQQGK